MSEELVGPFSPERYDTGDGVTESIFRNDPPPIITRACRATQGVKKPLPLMRITQVMSFIKKGRWNGGCFEWSGAIQHGGYGLVYIGSQPFRAHRVSFFLYYGIDPGSLVVMHKCDNRRCFNPLHLRLGDRVDNVMDCKAKGRTANRFTGHGTHTHPERYRGERCGASKLTRSQVLRIIDLWKQESLSQKSISRMFGICQQTVSDIIDGRTWKWMTHITKDIS